MQWLFDLPYAHAFFTFGLVYATFYSLFSTGRGVVRMVRAPRSNPRSKLQKTDDREGWRNSSIGSAIGTDQGLNRYNIHNDTYRFFS
jgi:hypothetical protein